MDNNEVMTIESPAVETPVAEAPAETPIVGAPLGEAPAFTLGPKGDERDANGKLILTEENYFSEEADKDYMSVSQFKNFAGNTVKSGCEYNGLLLAKKIIRQATTTPLLQGSYVDAYFEGTLDKFKEENKDLLFKKTGDKGLKSEFLKSEAIIKRVNDDPEFMKFMSGQKQVIMTGNLFGVDWKIKMDSYFPDDKIVDLKCMRNTEPIWCDKVGSKQHFIMAWGYDIQGAIYQKIVEINTGKKLPFYIAVATKEDIPDIQLIEIDQEYLDMALLFVEENIKRVLDVKNEKVEPIHCGHCPLCKRNKKLSGPIKLSTLIPKSKNFGTDNDDEDADGVDTDTPIYDEAPPATGFSLF